MQAAARPRNLLCSCSGLSGTATLPDMLSIWQTRRLPSVQVIVMRLPHCFGYRSVKSGKVVFLISHRLYHFPQLQQVIFMEDGKTAVGTHEELLRTVPAYRRLYESQTGGTAHEKQP